MAHSNTLLVVASDVALSNSFATPFIVDGYQTVRATEGIAGMRLARTGHPDIIIVDADLPDVDGMMLCGMIRKQSASLIILLTDGTNELQRIVGLDIGADLCLVKPLSLAELRAWIHALLRRAGKHPVRPPPLVVGHLRLDLPQRRAWLSTQELRLTPKEFDLLACLMQHRGVVLPREQIIKAVWGKRMAPRSQTLEVHICWLRQKIEPDPDRPSYIQTVRMIGYRFDVPYSIR